MSFIKEPEKSLAKSSNNSSRVLYNYKKVFKEKDSITLSGPDMVDTRDERQLYGKLDLGRRLVYISESKLVSIPSEKNDVLLVADFVAEAFSEFRSSMRKALLKLNPDGKSIHLFNLEPVRAWTSPSKLHHQMLNSLYLFFFNDYINNNKIDEKIVDFDSFVQVIIPFLRNASREFGIPFTFSGFINSAACTPAISGLMIDIYDENTNNDIVKNKLFLESPYFKFFRKNAKLFGFVIDKNIPWRLTADLSSIAMKKYMYKRGVKYRNVFPAYYHRAIDYDIDKMKQYLVGFYNSLVTSRPIIKRTEYCQKGKKLTTSEVIKRNTIDQETIDYKYPDFYWLEQYMMLRSYETNSSLENNDFQLASRKIKRMLRNLDISRVMVYIDNLIREHSTIGANLFVQEKWTDFEFAPKFEAGTFTTAVDVEEEEAPPPEEPAIQYFGAPSTTVLDEDDC